MGKRVKFYEDVQVTIYNGNQEETRIVPDDIVAEWCRTFWHLNGQTGSFDSIREAFTAPLFHSPRSENEHDDQGQSRSPEAQSGSNGNQASAHSHGMADSVSSLIESLHDVESKDQNKAVVRSVEVWFLRVQHFHVCIRPRRLQVKEVRSEQELVEACKRLWFDLLGDETCDLFIANPIPVAGPSTIAHVMLVQGDITNFHAVMLHTDALPPLQRQRVALVPQGSHVRRVFQVFPVRVSLP